jgi:hypothetical protein
MRYSQHFLEHIYNISTTKGEPEELPHEKASNPQKRKRNQEIKHPSESQDTLCDGAARHQG